MSRKKTSLIIFMLCGTVCLFSFFTNQYSSTPEEKIKAWYAARLKSLSQNIALLQAAVETNQTTATIHDRFLQARLSYKKIELLLEYYFESDALRFNGLAVDFIEEEDPTAYQQPQGFQMIETFIYPQYDTLKKNDLLRYINQLAAISNGLSGNNSIFNPEDFAMDAAMEELYRILALGITGFDSPIAQLSLPEAKASLTSVQFIMEVYKIKLTAARFAEYNAVMRLLQQAQLYLVQHNNINTFNRAVFITRFLNPATALVGKAKTIAGFTDNPNRYTLIKKSSHLFNAKSLNRGRYLYDDTINDARIALGKKIFNEPLLSANGKRSCAGCHQPGKSFTDGLPKALQTDEHSLLPRNTPSLWNAALQMNLFYDSRKKKLDDVVLEVLSNEKEMNSDADVAAKKINESAAYRKMFAEAYPSRDGIITDKNIANAIAMYIRSLISYHSTFDKYMRGEKNNMQADEIKGFNLFMGKAKCATCHYVPLFNGSKPPTYYYQESEVLGVPATTDTVHPVLDSDPGRFVSLPVDFMKHAFKTPTLRNIALTAPYMHNGVYKTLEEVIDFYDKGGGQGLGLAVPNQTLPPDKLHLTITEKHQLKAFLFTLTDSSAKEALSR